MERSKVNWMVTGVLAALLIGVASAPLGAQEAPLKLAVVDVDVVIAESPQGKDLQSRLERFQVEVQQELERLQAEAVAIRQQITDGANALSDERLAELEKQYEDATIAARRYRDDKQRQGTKLQEEGLREIERALQPIFGQVRDELGYDVILNRVPGVVLLASQRADITPLMVEKVKALAAASTPADSD